MSAYNQPTESLPSFNNEVFSQPIVNLSQAEADLLYLSKTKNDISTASSTTFNGNVNVGGNITGSTLRQSNTTSVSTNRIFDNLFSGSTLTLGTSTSSNTINGNSDFGSIVSIKNKLKLSQMTNIDIDSSAFVALDFPLNEVNVIRAAGLTSATIQLPAVTLNEAGLMFSFFKFQVNLAITLTSTSKIYTLNNFAVGLTSNTTLLSTDKQMTTLMCGFYGPTERYWVEVSNYSTVDRDYNNSIYPRLLTANSFSNRLNFSATSYSFPFASSQSLGYYLKTTGTSQSVTSATATTILTTPTIPIGVWRIDFSVQNTIGATGAGTITQSQSYLSTTLNGAIATAVSFTGSILRSHTSEVYANNDVQVITSSITYNQSTAGVLYLNILRTFGTGTYSFIGEVAITRLA